MIELKLTIEEVDLILASFDIVVKAEGIQAAQQLMPLNAKIREEADKSPEVIAMKAKQAKQENIPKPTVKKAKKKPGPKKKNK